MTTGARSQPTTIEKRGSHRPSPTTLVSGMTWAVRSVLIGLVRLYQLTLGALLPDACRFTPTCSQYFIAAVTKHGAFKGVWLGIRRIARCHPFCAGGHDPVP
jgi:uncharacterized protein